MPCKSKRNNALDFQHHEIYKVYIVIVKITIVAPSYFLFCGEERTNFYILDPLLQSIEF
jgi:hypothetical protein